MSLQPSTGQSGAKKPKKGYSDVQQGIKVLYQEEGADSIPNVDIVFVPGLGASPEESWKSTDTDFNWASDRTNGIARDFPKARVLLYQYESAWKGPLKVKQFLYNIAKTLLHALKSKREDSPRRPIVFIGHSMGGLVVAKAISIADAQRDLFPNMLETIAGCAFFGTPFQGAAAAAAAAMLARAGEWFGKTLSSKLLDIMTPGDEGLREMVDEFMRLVGKGGQRIDLFCFYETQPTDLAQAARLPSLFSLVGGLPKSLSLLVSSESAMLVGVPSMSIASNHRNLVKFHDFTEERYQTVRGPLKDMIKGAQLVVKNRLNFIRNIDREMVKSIMDVLDGAQISKKKLKALAQNFTPSSWILNEEEFKQWLHTGPSHESPGTQVSDCLYVQGPEGRGKTSTTIAVLDAIDIMIKEDEKNNTGQAPAIVAYFLCDPSSDYSSAEDLLKSLIRQLIDQQESLAQYAKHLAKKKDDTSAKTQVKLTVENLWQTLQDMLSDEFIGRRVYFVINNLHVLPEDTDSTVTLLQYINNDLQLIKDEDQKHVLTSWMFTSREVHSIKEALTGSGTRIIDLENEKYGNQVQLELRKHAHKRVAALGSEKKYNKALSYFASSLMGKRASNTHWIDITVVQLQELNESDNDLKVRRFLERMPQDLKVLLERAWLQIFTINDDDAEKLKEVLRALVLTFEDTTEPELAVLAGFPSTEAGKAELSRLVKLCKPLLTIKPGKTENKICFMNIVVKTHLLEKEYAKELLGLSEEETKWQHGVLALRSLSHVMEAFDYPEPEKETVELKQEADAINENGDGEDQDMADQDDAEEDDDDDNNDDDGESQDADQDEDDDVEYWDDESSEESLDLGLDKEAEDKALPYAVKHWLHHASKATREIAEDLSLEKEFWEPESNIRRRWLSEFERLTSTYKGYDLSSFTALHLAASIGFRQLVAALIRNGHANEIHQRDTLFNSPLHFAAYYGRPNIVEELLDNHANVDDASEIPEQTPLFMAAFAGHVNVMTKLIKRGANPNAVAPDVGPVVNSAIYSGNRDAVKLLVEAGVSLTEANGEGHTPLVLAALLSEITMFEYLIEKYADRLPAEEYNKALVMAARAGRVEVFNKLLPYPHEQEHFQLAIEAATEEENWDIVMILLDKCQGLDCDRVFWVAAIGVEPQDKVLEAVWQHTSGQISPELLGHCLYEATDKEKLSTVKLLVVKFGTDPDAKGEEFGDALTAAAYDGTLPIVQLLLDHGANVNSPDGCALQAAASESHIDVVRELLDRGADANAETAIENFPPTALLAACAASKVEIIEMLLEHDADPNLGVNGLFPIHTAAKLGEDGIVELLVNSHAELNMKIPEQGNSTVLIAAAEYLQAKTIKLLLDAGAEINTTDDEGCSALIAAARTNDPERIRLLLDYGADIMHSGNDGMNALEVAMHGNNEEGEHILITRLSQIMKALSDAMHSGNTAVADIIRGVGVTNWEAIQNSSPGLAIRPRNTIENDDADPEEETAEADAEGPEREEHEETDAEEAPEEDDDADEPVENEEMSDEEAQSE